MQEHNKNINKEIEKIAKYQTEARELKNTINELRNWDNKWNNIHVIGIQEGKDTKKQKTYVKK